MLHIHFKSVWPQKSKRDETGQNLHFCILHQNVLKGQVSHVLTLLHSCNVISHTVQLHQRKKKMMAFPLTVSGILGHFLLLLKLLRYAKYTSKRMMASCLLLCLYLTSVLGQLPVHLLVGYNQVDSGISSVVVSLAPSSFFFT